MLRVQPFNPQCVNTYTEVFFSSKLLFTQASIMRGMRTKLGM